MQIPVKINGVDLELESVGISGGYTFSGYRLNRPHLLEYQND